MIITVSMPVSTQGRSTNQREIIHNSHTPNKEEQHMDKNGNHKFHINQRDGDQILYTEEQNALLLASSIFVFVFPLLLRKL